MHARHVSETVRTTKFPFVKIGLAENQLKGNCIAINYFLQRTRAALRNTDHDSLLSPLQSLRVLCIPTEMLKKCAKKALKPKPMNVLRKPASPHAYSGVDTSSTPTALSGFVLRFASVDTKP